MLCSPQNPTGTVIGRADLERLAAFALARGMTILSDEIHCDLVLDSGRAHTVTASLGPEVAARTITLMAPSKTYNLPGLAWIDCRPAGLADPSGAFLAAGVKLMDGTRFGAPGFVRLNFACPRTRLSEALRRMRSALPGH